MRFTPQDQSQTGVLTAVRLAGIALLFACLACRLPAAAQERFLSQERTGIPEGKVLPQPTVTLDAPTPWAQPAGVPTVPAPPVETQLPVEEVMTAAPTPAYQPRFETAPCAFQAPPGTDPVCGYLVVPENRASPESAMIRLHAAVFRSNAAAPAPDPVVYLSGGPGASALELAGYLFRSGLGAVLGRRDLVLFDQRGTGYSRPRLDCPERQELNALLLEQGLASTAAGEQIVDAYRRCRARLLAEGVDLSAYTSAASAADVDDLRLALGYEQFNLYAVSYGTRLGLTVMRDFPQALRSAVLDSVYPPQENLYTALAPNAQRSFEVFFARCAADALCNTAYPGLGEVFYALADQLNASPVRVSFFAGGMERAALLDGNLLVDVLFVGMYNPAVTVRMPEMIYGVRRGEYGILRERLALYFDSSNALGMQMAVQCAEEISFSSAVDAFNAAQGVQPQIAAFFPRSVAPLFDACREWRSAPPDPRENQPVRSAVPALVLAGGVDPITPPQWGRDSAVYLERVYFFEFPGQGHWVTRSSPCALQMALAFWDDPGQAPDAGCAR